MYRGTVPGRGGGGEYRRGDTKEEDRGRRDGDTYAVERREERGDSERLLSLRQTVLLVGHSPTLYQTYTKFVLAATWIAVQSECTMRGQYHQLSIHSMCSCPQRRGCVYRGFYEASQLAVTVAS